MGGCKQKWYVQPWAVPLKKGHASPSFSLTPGCLDEGSSVRRPTPPPRAGAPEDSVEHSYCSCLGFSMRQKQTCILFKSLLYGSLCYISQTSNSPSWTHHCVQGIKSADWPDLGLGLYPWIWGWDQAHLNSRDWKRWKRCSPRNVGILLPGKREMSAAQANDSPAPAEVPGLWSSYQVPGNGLISFGYEDGPHW